MSKNTGSATTRREPIGADRLAKWKAALAASNRSNRNRRGRRKRGLDTANGPGMVRLTVVAERDHAGDHPGPVGHPSVDHPPAR